MVIAATRWCVARNDGTFWGLLYRAGVELPHGRIGILQHLVYERLEELLLAACLLRLAVPGSISSKKVVTFLLSP